MRRGTYLLFVTFTETTEIIVGALGTYTVSNGEYCYIGSAMNGLDSRISRHLSKNKKLRWHIDYLTLLSSYSEAYTSVVPECRLAEIAEESGCVPFIEGFGCSDCRCHTHLFQFLKNLRMN